MASQDDFELYPREITDLRVSASQSYPIELSNGRALSAKRRVEVKAAVNTETGAVRFYIDPDDVARLHRAQNEPKSTQEFPPKPSGS